MDETRTGDTSPTPPANLRGGGTLVPNTDRPQKVGISDQELGVRFTYHPPTREQSDIYEDLRGRALKFAHYLVDVTPASREQALAITNLEEAVFWANAAIARRST